MKEGDVVYAKTIGSNVFQATIKHTTWGFFGKKYLCEWTVNDMDYKERYRNVGMLYWWNIIGQAK